jgi:type IV secretory pathway TrbD component
MRWRQLLSTRVRVSTWKLWCEYWLLGNSRLLKVLVLDHCRLLGMPFGVDRLIVVADRLLHVALEFGLLWNILASLGIVAVFVCGDTVGVLVKRRCKLMLLLRCRTIRECGNPDVVCVLLCRGLSAVLDFLGTCWAWRAQRSHPCFACT